MANVRKLEGVSRKMVMTAMLSAVSTVLLFLNFPVPLMPSFIKFDFSELPALIASFSMGPLWGVLVCFVKNLINLFLDGFETFGVGELSNFLLGVSLVLPAGILYRFMRGRRGALIGCLAGSVLMALVTLPSNYFLIYPVYATVFVPGATVEEGMQVIIGLYQVILPWADSLWKCLLVFNAPFTLVKGLANTLLCFLVYKPLSHFIQGKARKKAEKRG
jgi:riboflavin transporter FmnP